MSGFQFEYRESEDVWWDKWNDCEAELTFEDTTLHEHLLPTCGCGSPDRLVDLLVWYLASIETPVGPVLGGRLDIHDDRYLLLAYMADLFGFTEHGTSVYGSWITPAGRSWLRLVAEGK